MVMIFLRMRACLKAVEPEVFESKRHPQAYTPTVQRLPRSRFTRHTRIGISVISNLDRAIQPHLHKGRTYRCCGDAA